MVTHAQTNASLTGTVRNEQKPLAGVVVTVSSPSLQGTRSTVSGENGAWFLAALPPGDYTVRFEMAGMQPVIDTVRLALAQTQRLDALMRLATMAENVTISAAVPSVLESSQVATNVTTAMLDQLPVGRTILAAVLMAPGVSSAGVNGPSIGGAPSYDNVYLVDGVVVNENIGGQPHDLFIEDAVQETTVLTGGISAEYGRFTGGVIDTITKSGGNSFSGSLRDNLTNPSWRQKTPWATEDDHVDDLSDIYEATLGGRIIRDRLWFFSAARLRETAEQRFTTATNLPYLLEREESRVEGKLTGQLTPKHSVSGSFIDIKDDRINDIATGVVLDYASLISHSLPNRLTSLIYSGVLTNNLLLEATFAEKEFSFVGRGAKSRDRIFGTMMIDTPTDRRFWSSTFCGVCTEEYRNNDTWSIKGRYFLSTHSMGSHSLTTGVEDYTERRLTNNNQSGSDFRVFANALVIGPDVFARIDTNTVVVWSPILNLSEFNHLSSAGVFMNDSWDLDNHWSFNLGLRFDKNKGRDTSGGLVSDDSAFSPRLGVQYDLFGDGRHTINANYSRYVTKIVDGNIGNHASSAGRPSFFSWRYGGPAINLPGTNPLIPTDQALQIVWNWFDSVGGTANREFLLLASEAGLAGRIVEPISSPFVDELTLGYGVHIGGNAFLRTDVVAREWANFYTQRVDQSTPKATDRFGNVGDVALLENDDSLERNYFGIQLQGQWRPGRGYVGGAYTYSELKGNDEGQLPQAGITANTPLDMFYPEFLSYQRRRPSGWLTEDVRHRGRVWVGYALPVPVIGQFNASILHSYETGAPYSAIGLIDATGRTAGTAYEGIPTNPGYTLSLIGGRHRYFFSERGEYRFEDYSRTDVALMYELPLGRVQFFAQAILTNVFDNHAVVAPFIENGVSLTGPDTTVFTRRTSASRGLSPFNPFTETPIECPQDASASTCQQMGAHWQKGPNFGQPTGVNSYQLPLTYGFTAGIRF